MENLFDKYSFDEENRKNFQKDKIPLLLSFENKVCKRGLKSLL